MTHGSEDSYEESTVVSRRKNFKKADRPSWFKKSTPEDDQKGSQPDQALVKEQILYQLYSISKLLNKV